MIPLVAIESPYAGGVAENVAYAKRCVIDCLSRGEAPYASHLFFTQDGLLDDAVPEERELGISAGLAWTARADIVAFYVDRGWSPGMRAAYDKAKGRKARILFRALGSVLSSEDVQGKS